GRAGARADEADEVGAEPHADLEHVAAAPLLEPGELGDERLEPVALPLHLGEELRGAERSRGRLGRAGPPLPVLADALLEPLGRLGHGRGRYPTGDGHPGRWLDSNPWWWAPSRRNDERRRRGHSRADSRRHQAFRRLQATAAARA